jgi:hypothetical protein
MLSVWRAESRKFQFFMDGAWQSFQEVMRIDQNLAKELAFA